MIENLNKSGPLTYGKIAKKSNRGRKPMQSAILTSPEVLDKLKQASEKRTAKKQKTVEASATKRGRKASNTATKSQTTSVKRGREAKETTKKETAKNQPISSSSEEEKEFCMGCNKYFEGRMTRFNTIECNTCQRPYHLKCVQLNGSFFTFENCDSDLDISPGEE